MRKAVRDRDRVRERRPVIGFMSGNQQDPDLMCEVFILAPTDLIDGHEFPFAGLSAALD
jgi:hypothetical protein